ncbi:endonuclease/exonuclease/phosphatase family protein [Hyphomonas sp.]|jgi:exodeoxyribonuclease-3|uniref:endonuclease/exonuclease/phosphatase family protein n=1 Tax=Hyphomonas sp. TaxID=87 RepID=UPI0039E69BCC
MLRRMILIGLTCLAGCATPETAAPVQLKVMSYNSWGAGGNQDKPIDETLAVLREVDADIIGLQETQLEGDVCDAEVCPPKGPSAAPALAKALGYYLYEQTAENDALWANAILSRYPIMGATPNDLGVSIDVKGHTVYAFNVHFTDYPYQPYQFDRIPYGDAPFLTTSEEGVAAARAARGAAVDLLVNELPASDGAEAVFIFGDFNEPSGLDWTARAVAAGIQPAVVAFPSSGALEAAGFIDAYRAVYPDEIAHPGLTWTPTTSVDDPTDRHDRIDYIFVRGTGVDIVDASIVGEASPPAEIAITPWPSDHRAVLATVTLATRHGL